MDMSAGAPVDAAGPLLPVTLTLTNCRNAALNSEDVNRGGLTSNRAGPMPYKYTISGKCEKPSGAANITAQFVAMTTQCDVGFGMMDSAFRQAKLFHLEFEGQYALPTVGVKDTGGVKSVTSYASVDLIFPNSGPIFSFASAAADSQKNLQRTHLLSVSGANFLGMQAILRMSLTCYNMSDADIQINASWQLSSMSATPVAQ